MRDDLTHVGEQYHRLVDCLLAREIDPYSAARGTMRQVIVERASFLTVAVRPTGLYDQLTFGDSSAAISHKPLAHPVCTGGEEQRKWKKV